MDIQRRQIVSNTVSSIVKSAYLFILMPESVKTHMQSLGSNMHVI